MASHNGGAKYKGVRKLGSFWPVSWCISEMVWDTAIDAIEVEWKPCPSCRMVALLMNLSDPNPQFQGEYLANGVCYGHCYYRTRIWSHSRAAEWCHFRWPRVTPTAVSMSPYSSKANISQTVHATASKMMLHGFLSNSWGFLFVLKLCSWIKDIQTWYIWSVGVEVMRV